MLALPFTEVCAWSGTAATKSSPAVASTLVTFFIWICPDCAFLHPSDSGPDADPLRQRRCQLRKCLWYADLEELIPAVCSRCEHIDVRIQHNRYSYCTLRRSL